MCCHAMSCHATQWDGILSGCYAMWLCDMVSCEVMLCDAKWLCDVVSCEVMLCDAKWLCDVVNGKMMCFKLRRAHVTLLRLSTSEY